MMNLSQIENIESPEVEQSDFEYFADVQQAINAGYPWRFQGSFGRTMMLAIDAGYCMLGKEPSRDYWGNYIPSRDEVQEGTKGSRGYVVDRQGEIWANSMEDL